MDKNNIVFLHKNLEIRISEGKGRGVFATADIPENTIILKEKVITLKCKTNNHFSYALKLIRKVLLKNKEEFLNLFPHTLDQITSPVNRKYIKHLNRNILNIPDETAILYYEKFAKNVFSYKNGSAVLFYGAKFNHSCNPNVDFYYKKKRFIFKTNRLIKKDEEIFDSYVDEELSTKDRQKDLLTDFGFICTCERCVN